MNAATNSDASAALCCKNPILGQSGLILGAWATSNDQPDSSRHSVAAAEGESAPTGQLSAETISVAKQPDFSHNDDAYFVTVTSKVDSITIEHIVNRGACQIFVMSSPPERFLHFGQAYKVLAQCNPIEVGVKTNQGSATYSMTD